MLQGEHSAILSTFIKLPFVIKLFVLTIFEWKFYTGFTVVIIRILRTFINSGPLELSVSKGPYSISRSVERASEKKKTKQLKVSYKITKGKTSMPPIGHIFDSSNLF